jgi:hypothetical protein
VTLEAASVFPFVIDPEAEADCRIGNDMADLLMFQNEMLQTGVPYPVEVAPLGAPVAHPGLYHETIGLDYGVLELRSVTSDGEGFGVIEVVEEGDCRRLPSNLALYRYGRLTRGLLPFPANPNLRGSRTAPRLLPSLPHSQPPRTPWT